VTERIFAIRAGAISGAGNSAKEQWASLKQGGPEFITFAEATKWLPFTLEGLHESFGEKLVCPVKHTNDELADMLSMKNSRGYDRHQLFALIAAQEAMAGIEGYDPLRFACVTATGGAGLIDIYQSMS
jgi:3-oxoacyl-(acyl-carrier-protein) synthase